jgi:hypothetical protein
LGVFFCLLYEIKGYTLVTAELHRNNMPVYHLLAFVEIAAVYSFYCQLIYNKIFKLGIIALLAFHLADSCFNEKIHTFNSLAWTIDMMVIILLGMLYFFKIYNNDGDLTPLEKRPDFIIMIGWLIYAAGSLFTYLMGTKILSGYAEGFFKNGWFFQTISNITKDIMVAYGFWLTRKR